MVIQIMTLPVFDPRINDRRLVKPESTVSFSMSTRADPKTRRCIIRDVGTIQGMLDALETFVIDGYASFVITGDTVDTTGEITTYRTEERHQLNAWLADVSARVLHIKDAYGPIIERIELRVEIEISFREDED